MITRKQKAKDLKVEKLKNNTVKQTLGQQDVLNGEVDVLLGESHQTGTYADDYNVMLDLDEGKSRAFNSVFHSSKQSLAEKAFNQIFHIPHETELLQMDDYDPWGDISAKLSAPTDNLIQIDSDIQLDMQSEVFDPILFNRKPKGVSLA